MLLLQALLGIDAIMKMQKRYAKCTIFILN